MIGFSPDRLREAREAKGWSQGELALQATTAWRTALGADPHSDTATGIAQTAVSTWERGSNTPPPDKLKWIAHVLGIPMDSLISVPEDERTLGTLRELAGRVQAELAAAAGISSPLLAAIERGHARLTDAVADRISSELELPVAAVRAAYERGRAR